MDACRIRIGFIVVFFAALVGSSTAPAQYAEIESDSRPSHEYFASLEYKPLTAILFAAPGGAGAGGELEVGLTRSFVATLGYAYMAVDPNDAQYAKLKEESDKKSASDNDDDDVNPRRFHASTLTGGVRWYPQRVLSSFYLGARAVAADAVTDYEYKDAQVTEKSGFIGPGVEFGYRWLFRFASVRLGLNGHAETGKTHEAGAEHTSTESDEAIAKLEKDAKENNKHVRLGGGIDLGLGVVF